MDAFEIAIRNLNERWERRLEAAREEVERLKAENRRLTGYSLELRTTIEEISGSAIVAEKLIDEPLHPSVAAALIQPATGRAVPTAPAATGTASAPVALASTIELPIPPESDAVFSTLEVFAPNHLLYEPPIPPAVAPGFRAVASEVRRSSTVPDKSVAVMPVRRAPSNRERP